MSGPAFSDLPKETQVRQAAVAVLKSAGTLAGSNVMDTPLDELLETAFPMITVVTSTDRTSMAQAGGIPVMKVDFTLTVSGFVIDADNGNVVLLHDLLADQIRSALLQDPVFISLLEPITAIETSAAGGMGKDDPRYIAVSEQKFQSAWREEFPPIFTTILADGGQPQAIRRTAIAPLTEIVTTIDTTGTGLASLSGTWTVTLLTPTTYQVADPTGAMQGSGTVGTASWAGIGFTMLAGTNAFAAGDSFTIAVLPPVKPMAVAASGNAGNGSIVGVSTARAFFDQKTALTG